MFIYNRCQTFKIQISDRTKLTKRKQSRQPLSRHKWMRFLDTYKSPLKLHGTILALETTMKSAHSTRNYRDVATKPIKIEQTNESPTIQFSPEENFNCLHTDKKNKLRPALEPLKLGSKGDGNTPTFLCFKNKASNKSKKVL